MKKLILLSFVFSLFFYNCQPKTENTIFQTSTIDALLSGVYDGDMSGNYLLKNGNFGIGTFDDLDGEMIVLNDTIFQVKADGKVYQPNLQIETPFASVCNFIPDTNFILSQPLNLENLEHRLDKILSNKNIFYAIKIRGNFNAMHTRSVPAQEKPYPPLKEVTAHQPKFHMKNISGTIVGFRCPSFVKGVNVPGYHLHFISNDRSKGGHILDFDLRNVRVEVDILNKFVLQLPSNKKFKNIDLDRDRSQELEEVEKK